MALLQKVVSGTSEISAAVGGEEIGEAHAANDQDCHEDKSAYQTSGVC